VRKHFAALIRHGECTDQVDGLHTSNPYDPALSALGMDQADAIGDYLKELF